MAARIARAERLRVWSFVAMLLVSPVFGASVMTDGLDAAPALVALACVYLACVVWIVADLRARRVVGARFWMQLAVALVPVLGLLIYFLWSSGAIGAIQWVAFVTALWIPGALAAGVALAIHICWPGAPC